MSRTARLHRQRAARRYDPTARKGDARRAALLEALEDLLSDRALADIAIADITSAAGVTRQAFYFYFPGKAAAVTALLETVYDEVLSSAADWYGSTDERTPRERLDSAFEATIRVWRSHATLMVAMLDAAGTDAEVRQIWEEWLNAFIQRVSARIGEEREAGVSTGTTDRDALATVLVGTVAFSMERDVRSIRSGEAPSEHTGEALVDLWHRALYAR